VTEFADVPAEMVARMRTICAGLPEAYEDQPWAGNRWRIRNRTFVHVFSVDSDKGPTPMMMFRADGPELEMLTNAGHPFAKAQWGSNVMLMIFDAETDWDEVAELVTESYCLMAPKKLVAQVDRPPE
jgi:predicted DNA-binding protein (MmcQ/YjbR family)